MSQASPIHVCVHGHFYQPPRESPWLEELEREDSAAPAHDWNERITQECYRPNAASPVLDSKGRVAALVNNYRHMSFNFGPTLMRWLERHDPITYQAILAADAESAAENHGHGNAIAQVYNHVILPLANARDKHTQIRWGARDFELRFRRKPEGMWLAETACDAATLAALAENGIAFTVLSPYQAESWRSLRGGDTAIPCGDGSIPSGRAYLYQKHGGRPLHLFFYDGGIAKGIAFEQLLNDANNVVGRVVGAWDSRPGPQEESWLVHTATDGESYGHHFRFGDMALSATFDRLQRDPRVRLTNYGTFLAQNSVVAEADIKSVSAWSCAHGVGRWAADCGCRMGSGPGWNWRWREHLRAALDGLRDRLATHYERAAAALVKDPWALRDAYIDVVFDRSRARAFFAEHKKRDVADDQVVTFYRLLELQRAALLMYTSCGWFFDDIAGQESVILMKYAARAIELARTTGIAQDGAPDPEVAFVAELERADANARAADGSKMSGGDVYRQRAQPSAVSADNVVVSYALRAMTERGRKAQGLYAWRVPHHEERRLTKGSVPFVVGRVVMEDERTLESQDRIYALAHFGGVDFRCSVKPFVSEAELADLTERVRKAALEGHTLAVMKEIDAAFAGPARTLKDAFLDLRHAAARAIGRQKMNVLAVVGAEMLESHHALLVSLKELGVGLPAHVASLAAFVLSNRADTLAHELIAATDDEDFADVESVWRALSAQLASVMDEASGLGVTVNPQAGARALLAALVDAVTDLGADAADTTLPVTTLEDRVARVVRLADAAALLHVTERDAALVAAVFSLCQQVACTPALAEGLMPHVDVLHRLDRVCGSAFAEALPAPFGGGAAPPNRLTGPENSTS